MHAAGDYVKVEFRKGETRGSEWMWVIVPLDDPKLLVIFGSLDSERIVCTDLQLGMQLTVGLRDLFTNRKVVFE